MVGRCATAWVIRPPMFVQLSHVQSTVCVADHVPVFTWLRFSRVCDFTLLNVTPLLELQILTYVPEDASEKRVNSAFCTVPPAKQESMYSARLSCACVGDTITLSTLIGLAISCRINESLTALFVTSAR